MPHDTGQHDNENCGNDPEVPGGYPRRAIRACRALGRMPYTGRMIRLIAQ